MRQWKYASLFVLGLWIIVALLTLNYNGPFFDEGIYITAGTRALEGHGISDGYLTWFAGSLLWPILSALGYQAGELIGTRVVALILATIAFACTAQATEDLFGARARFWTTLTLAVSAPFFALARLGVYDLPALAGIGVAFWSITRLYRTDHRLWALIAALGFTVALFSKYPMGLMALPLAGLLIVLRRRQARMDVPLIAFISAAISLAFFLPARQQLGALYLWQIANKPTFGSSYAMMIFAAGYYNLLPLLLAGAAALWLRGQRFLHGVLFLSLLIWPAYHLISGNPVGDTKHIVFGFLFGYALIGQGLSRLWEHRFRRVLAPLAALLLAGLGAYQFPQFQKAWPDIRPPAGYLLAHVQPGQKLLINESWPYTMYLYTNGLIASPWDVFDVYRITHGESEIDLCQYDWLVNSSGSYDWPQDVLDQIQACGTFQPVYSWQTPAIGLGNDLHFLQYNVHTTIWHNAAGGTAR